MRTTPLLFDVFAPYVARLERELGHPSSKRVGRSHGIVDLASYQMRIDAVDFALTTDDGLGTTHYQRADIILVGASRVGKTPTCLFLALQYGVRASNYPLAEDDFERGDLPEALASYTKTRFLASPSTPCGSTGFATSVRRGACTPRSSVATTR